MKVKKKKNAPKKKKALIIYIAIEIFKKITLKWRLTKMIMLIELVKEFISLWFVTSQLNGPS